MPAKTRFDVPAMRREFLATNITLRALAEKHGCSYRYVSGLSSTEKWYPKRRELQRQQEAAVTDALVERVAELAQLKPLTAEEHVSIQTFIKPKGIPPDGPVKCFSRCSAPYHSTLYSFIATHSMHGERLASLGGGVTIQKQSRQ